MKITRRPTQRETILSEKDLIISKTDTSGRITYVNRTFMRISQHNEDGLLGKQHNVIRHPDMPKVIFKMLWETLKTDNEYFAYIKNICQDGGFYWVLANVTPDYTSSGKLQGYLSVHRKPSPASIADIIPLYTELAAIEKQHTPKQGLIAAQAYLDNYLSQQQISYNQFIFNLLKQDGYL